MDLFWQQVIIGLSVFAAVAYLAQYFFRRAFRRKPPCESCGLMKMVEKKRKKER